MLDYKTYDTNLKRISAIYEIALECAMLANEINRGYDHTTLIDHLPLGELFRLACMDEGKEKDKMIEFISHKMVNTAKAGGQRYG